MTWIFRYRLVFAVLSGIVAVLLALAAGRLAVREEDHEREVEAARELVSYAATLEGGTIYSRAMVDLAEARGPLGIPAVRPVAGRAERGIFLAALVRCGSWPSGIVRARIDVDRLATVLCSWTKGPALLLSPQGVVVAADRDARNLRPLGAIGAAHLRQLQGEHRFG